MPTPTETLCCALCQQSATHTVTWTDRGSLTPAQRSLPYCAGHGQHAARTRGGSLTAGVDHSRTPVYVMVHRYEPTPSPLGHQHTLITERRIDVKTDTIPVAAYRPGRAVDPDVTAWITKCADAALAQRGRTRDLRDRYTAIVSVNNRPLAWADV